jgi:hypothetical protein
MKKTITLMCVVTLALTACTGSATPATDEATLEDLTLVQPTEPQIPQEETQESEREEEVAEEDPWLSHFSEYATINAFQFNWESVSGYICNILTERVWTEQYEEELGATYDEAVSRLILAQQSSSTCEEFDAMVCEVALAYLSVLSSTEFEWGERENVTFVRSQEHSRGEVWYRANNPVFLEMLHYYDITQEEFVREHERRLREYSALDDPDTLEFVSHMIFPIEHIDILFSGDDAAIKRAALVPWAIMVEDEVYSAQWLIDHTPEDWAEAGLTLAEIEKSFEIFNVLLGDYEVSAFESDLEVFEREYQS